MFTNTDTTRNLDTAMTDSTATVTNPPPPCLVLNYEITGYPMFSVDDIYQEAERKVKEQSIDSEMHSTITISNAPLSPRPSTATSLASSGKYQKEMSLLRLIFILAVLSLALFIAAIDQTIVATATVKITEEFNALPLAPWLANAYLLSSTALQPSTGKLSDILGRTPMLLAGLVVFAIGSLICAVAHSMAVLLVGRAVAGVGSAAIIGLTLVIVADIVPLRKRGPYMAVFSLVFSFSSVVGPLLGGVFTDHVSWRWIFWISLPITGVVVVAIVFLLRLPKQQSQQSAWTKLKRIDYLGIVLLVGGLVALLLGLTLPSTSSDMPWNSAAVIGCLVSGIVILVAFGLVEWRVAKDPIIPLRLFRIRNVWLVFTATFFMGASLFTPIYYIPIYYNVVQNTSSTIAGIYLLPFVIGIMLTSIVTGFLVMKYGHYRPYIWSGTAVCAIGLGLLSLLDRQSGNAERICFLLIAGLGMGAFIQLSIITAQAAVKHADMATVTAVLTFFRSVGSVVGMAIMQTVLFVELKSNASELKSQYGNLSAIDEAVNSPSVIYSSSVDTDLRNALVDAYMSALHKVFVAMIPMGVLMFVFTVPLRHKRLASRIPKRKPST